MSSKKRSKIAFAFVCLAASGFVGSLVGVYLPKQTPETIFLTLAGALVWAVLAGSLFPPLTFASGGGAPDIHFRLKGVLGSLGCALAFELAAAQEYMHAWSMRIEQTFLLPFVMLAALLIYAAIREEDVLETAP